jgi:hypothetical protein
MTGGIIQLVAYGIENIYLTEDPQVTFFKIVYRRHTNFSIESIPQYFNIKANFGTRVSCTVARNGDLMNRIYVVVTLPNISELPNGAIMRWVNNVGFTLISLVELEIGGKVIDTHYSDWLYIWNELNKDNNRKGIDHLIGNMPELTEYSASKDAYTLCIPLNFWFCHNLSMSLPIVALEYSEVKINIEFASIRDCIITGPTNYIYITDAVSLFKPHELISINGTESYVQYVNFNQTTMQFGYIKTDPSIVLNVGDVLTGIESGYTTTVYDPSTNIYPTITTNIEVLNLTKSNTSFLYIDYVYLDNMERVKFARSDHEYLIDVCQYDNEKNIYNSSNKIKVGYSYPTKELLIRAQMAYMTSNENQFYSDQYNYTTSVNKNIAKSLIKKILIKLNGFNRDPDYDKNFYSYVQSLQHHKAPAPLGLFLYSFALNPFNSQPSGSCNFSKIDDISIDISVEPISYNKPALVRIYAISYNIFRIINGVAGLAFQN